MSGRRGDGDAKPPTDEQLAALRRARFGELPERIDPTDLVETNETDPPDEDYPQPLTRREWGG